MYHANVPTPTITIKTDSPAKIASFQSSIFFSDRNMKISFTLK